MTLKVLGKIPEECDKLCIIYGLKSKGRGIYYIVFNGLFQNIIC